MTDTAELLARLVSLHPRDTARLLDVMATTEADPLLETLPDETRCRVLSVMSPAKAADVLEAHPPDERAALLERMDPEAAVEIVQALEDPERVQTIDSLSPEATQRLAEATHYPPNTAGSMMRREVTTLADDLTVERAISLLRKAPRQQLHYLYVVDADRQLVGVLPIRELLLAKPRQPIRELVPSTLITVPVDADRDRVLHIIEERKLLALPVIDRQDRLLGVVTSVDAVAEGERSGLEAMQRAVGAGADESALSPVREVVRRRLPWLCVNLITAFSAAAVVGLFEDVIAKVTALAVLLPVVSGQGGNSGSQSLAIVMRGLALKEVLPGTARWVVIKEVAAGLCNSVVIALITAGAVYLWSQSPGLALVIGLAMIVNMTAAAFTGSLIPVALERLGRDPAQASTIILTTVTDIIGFAAFLGFAVLMSNML